MSPLINTEDSTGRKHEIQWMKVNHKGKKRKKNLTADNENGKGGN